MAEIFSQASPRQANSFARWIATFALSVVFGLTAQAQYASKNDKKFWGGVGLVGLPVANHVLSGLNFELEYYYSKRFAIGAGLSIAQGKTTQLSGFNYAHPSLSVGNIVMMNRFKIIDGDNFQASLFIKSGFEPVEIRNDNGSLWSHMLFDAGRSKSDTSSRSTNFFVFQPGIATAFRLWDSGKLKDGSYTSTYLTLELSYRYLDGKSKFGSNTYFSGVEISLGMYIDN